MVAQQQSREVYRSFKMFFTHTGLHRSARYGHTPSVFFNPHAVDRWAQALTSPSTKGLRVESDDTGVTLSLDVPGLSKEHLTIAMEGAVVRIDAKADAPRSFKAAYELAFDIDAAQSQAKLEHGVLTLKLGKVAPVSRETVLAID
jgi:HSP20 family protein